jgi:putative endonuclease
MWSFSFYMKFSVYILYSKTHDKIYVGYTNDLERRLWEHNNSTQSSFTSRFYANLYAGVESYIGINLWDVIHTEEFSTKKEAMSRETWFKTGVGRKLKEEILAKYLIEK